MRSSSRLENLLPHEITHPVVKPTEDDIGRGNNKPIQYYGEEPKNKIEAMKLMAEARKMTSKSSYANRKNNKGKSKRKKR